jgi:hypothetical protein
MAEVKSQVMESRSALKVTSFNEINEPGCYIIMGSGDLVRVPREALATGRSPLITIHSKGATRVAQLSNDDAEPVTHLRHLAADNDIKPNF